MYAAPQTLVVGLVDALIDEQPVTRRKANTVTVAIGSALTALAAAGTYWIESGSDAPDWLPLLVLVIGQLVTVMATSRTRNGVTPSLRDDLSAELVRHLDDPAPATGAADLDVDEVRRTADRLAGNQRATEG